MPERDHTRRRFLQSAAHVAVAGKLQMLDQFFEAADGELDSLSRATGWVNSRPLTASDLRGKVVLVQFWTFTCINWLRTLPYVRAWADKYRGPGLVVIGAHSPEFAFERSTENVRRMTAALNVTYPVAIDTDFAIWKRFGNRYWPALYLIDAKGHIRHQKFGEGAYDETERAIQQLLIEAGARQVDSRPAAVVATGAEAAADWAAVKTGETYVGYERGENFSSPGGLVRDRTQVYSLPGTLRANQWALAGDWVARKDAIALSQARERRCERSAPLPAHSSAEADHRARVPDRVSRSRRRSVRVHVRLTSTDRHHRPIERRTRPRKIAATRATAFGESLCLPLTRPESLKCQNDAISIAAISAAQPRLAHSPSSALPGDSTP
jgi:thiol-disulfide isomerase/thioredoxin